MKSSSKWLLGFGGAIGILVVLAVVLVLTIPGNDQIELLPDSTPNGIVQRYIYAIKNKDYEEAYGYLSNSVLADEPRYDTFEEWSETFLTPDRTDAWRATVGEPEYRGEKAVVTVTIDFFTPGGIFSNPVNTVNYPFTLEKQDGVWKITSPLYGKLFY